MWAAYIARIMNLGTNNNIMTAAWYKREGARQ